MRDTGGNEYPPNEQHTNIKIVLQSLARRCEINGSMRVHVCVELGVSPGEAPCYPRATSCSFGAPHRSAGPGTQYRIVWPSIVWPRVGAVTCSVGSGRAVRGQQGWSVGPHVAKSGVWGHMPCTRGSGRACTHRERLLLATLLRPQRLPPGLIVSSEGAAHRRRAHRARARRA